VSTYPAGIDWLMFYYLVVCLFDCIFVHRKSVLHCQQPMCVSASECVGRRRFSSLVLSHFTHFACCSTRHNTVVISLVELLLLSKILIRVLHPLAEFYALFLYIIIIT